MRDAVWAHLGGFENSKKPLVIVTHVPLHKESAVCVDKYATKIDANGWVAMQNFISENATNYILDSLRPRFVFTGHDHEGCASFPSPPSNPSLSFFLSLFFYCAFLSFFSFCVFFRWLRWMRCFPFNFSFIVFSFQLS